MLWLLAPYAVPLFAFVVTVAFVAMLVNIVIRDKQPPPKGYRHARD